QVRRNSNNTTTSFQTQLKYDNKGEVTSSTDPLNGTTRASYGPYGVVLTTSDALGNTVTNAYDSNSNLTSTTSAAGVTTSFGYDGNNNLASVTQSTPAFGPGGQPQAMTLFTYDSNGYLLTSTTPTGVTTSHSVGGQPGYDANGNPTGTTLTWTNPANS